jgi:hypothetical protein
MIQANAESCPTFYGEVREEVRERDASERLATLENLSLTFGRVPPNPSLAGGVVSRKFTSLKVTDVSRSTCDLEKRALCGRGRCLWAPFVRINFGIR